VQGIFFKIRYNIALREMKKDDVDYDSDEEYDDDNEEEENNDPRNNTAFRQMSKLAEESSNHSLQPKSQIRYKSCMKALKNHLAAYNPEFLNNNDCSNVEESDFNFEEEMPWEVCLQAFLGSRKFDSRKLAKGEHYLVHKKTLAQNVTVINRLYETQKIAMSVDVHSKVTKMIQGHANELGTKRKNCEMPATEGKKEFTFAEMESIAKTSLGQGAVMSWLFLLLLWSLIARSVSVALLQFKSFSWGGDCLVIHLGSVSVTFYNRLNKCSQFLATLCQPIES